jgi:hypothetical protein
MDVDVATQAHRQTPAEAVGPAGLKPVNEYLTNKRMAHLIRLFVSPIR